MAQKTKTREITIVDKAGAFNTFFKRLSGEEKEYDFEGIGALRKLLSNERARILHVVKTKNPQSIYALAKMLKRDFKSVKQDIILLERFGFITLSGEKTGKRERLRPTLTADTIIIQIKI